MSPEEVSKVVGPEFKENVENPPPGVQKLKKELEGKTAEWKGWDEDMPVQVVSDSKIEVFENLAEAKEAHPGLDPKKGGGGFHWAMKGEVKGKPAIRFESHKTYRDMTAASGLYGFTKEAERVCGSATTKLSKFTSKLAKALFEKDANSPGFLEEHTKRTGSRAAKMLRACMASIGPGSPAAEEVEEETETPEKTAGKRETGRYGYSAKTAKLALQACSDVEHEAGVVASDLHARMGSKHATITGYLGKHSKRGKCGWSEMIMEAYPPAPAQITASVSEILAWDGPSDKSVGRVASSFLAADDEDAEEESPR